MADSSRIERLARVFAGASSNTGPSKAADVNKRKRRKPAKAKRSVEIHCA